MRILRIKRGYTTNSSSANDWVPPNSNQPPNVEPPGTLTGMKIGETRVLMQEQNHALGNPSNLYLAGSFIITVSGLFVLLKVWKYIQKKRKLRQYFD